MSETDSAASLELQARLFSMRDEKYAAFARKLAPNVAPERVIGVRTPQLHALAGELFKTSCADQFMRSLPHRYYEENNLHAALLCRVKDFGEAEAALDAFLPFVDNWATCDGIKPKAFAAHPQQLPCKIREWLASDREYTVRFALEMLMTYYLDGFFLPEYLELAASARQPEYYVRMMVAWLFATALAKQYAAALPYIEQRRLEPWTHNKTIQKAIESYRITDAQKAYLRTLKIPAAKEAR